MEEQEEQGPAPRRPDRPGKGETEPAAPSPEASTGTAEAGPRTPVTQQIGRAVVVLLIVLVGVFAASNAHRVDFSWVLGETRVVEGPGDEVQGGVPLIVLLLVSFVVGVTVGALLLWQSSKARRMARRERPDRQSRSR
jgi:uncharacterized integral membrane protein